MRLWVLLQSGQAQILKSDQGCSLQFLSFALVAETSVQEDYVSSILDDILQVEALRQICTCGSLSSWFIGLLEINVRPLWCNPTSGPG